MDVAVTSKLNSAASADELVPTRESLLGRLRNLEDQTAWQEFFDTYWRLIYCAATKFGLPNDEAEDVVQETVIGVARAMGTFRYQPQTCSFKGWLMLITRRRVIDRLRRRQRQLGSFEPWQAGSDTATDAVLCVPDAAAERAFAGLWDEEWEKNVVEVALEQVKRKVGPEQYQIFFLRAVRKMPARDISELLSVSQAKIYVVGHRVGRLVKKEVKRLNGANG